MENPPAATRTLSPPPFTVPSRANSAQAWAERMWHDLQPTPGRLSGSLRIVLATMLTMQAVLILQVPYASVALYFVFFVGRESPAVSLRSLFMVVPIVAAVFATFGIIILTDNEPIARVLGVAVVSFIVGVGTLSTTAPALCSVFAYIFVTMIAFWETPAPADHLVKLSLWSISSLSIPLLASIAVEYVVGVRRPADLLAEQNRIRWQAFIAMFALFAEKASPEERAEAAIRVSGLAATGQDGMQALYNKIVGRNLDTGSLNIGGRIRITMLAQLMDLGAAVGSATYADDPDSLVRYKRIVSEAQTAFEGSPETQPASHEFHLDPHPALLDRVEAMLHAIRSMPGAPEPDDRHLVATRAQKVPFVIPRGYTNPANVAFGLKLSLCATICYIVYHAIDYPGISTCVITIFITGLGTTGAIKQKFVFRLLGSMLGGLIGLGAAAFLFPNMDSITSLAVLIAVIAFIAGWTAQGRRFSYVGMQIAFSFYLVAFEGFSAPTKLAPPRDRLVGIVLALVVMWVVFDQFWPVRTVSVMRRTLATLLQDGAKLFRLPDSAMQRDGVLKQTEALRDQVGRTTAGLRTMNDAVEYEFGKDREQHIQLSETILRAALTAVALFWNQTVLLYHKRDHDLLNDARVAELRHGIAATMEAMANSVAHAKAFVEPDDSQLLNDSHFENPRHRDYAENALTRLRELRAYVRSIDAG